MGLQRRSFLRNAAMASTLIVSGIPSTVSARIANNKRPNDGVSKIQLDDVAPISSKEREERIIRAQELMVTQKIGAVVLDAGTTLEYFTGISWWPSERTMVAVIPSKGAVKYICPGFEEDRLRELISIGKEVYVWQEDESPYLQIIKAINNAGISAGNIGIEERLRFFIYDGIKKLGPNFNFISADGVTATCRMIKSAHEIKLMQKANDITVAAIKAGISQLKEGMSPGEFSAAVAAVHRQLGAEHDFAMANFGEASALPHGSVKPQRLKIGDTVLMDCGCRVHGYSSDISRTIVFGANPTKRQLDIWNLEQKSQAAGFAAAQIGQPCENVDIAARKVITDAGFGPNYKVPGLPHRTGHGIGMDGHEWGNMVRGNKKLLEPGMCFSIEPTIAIPGEFGVRLEDCAYMTATGVQWFSQPSPSISQPFV